MREGGQKLSNIAWRHLWTTPYPLSHVRQNCLSCSKTYLCSTMSLLFPKLFEKFFFQNSKFFSKLCLSENKFTAGLLFYTIRLFEQSFVCWSCCCKSSVYTSTERDLYLIKLVLFWTFSWNQVYFVVEFKLIKQS